MHGSLFANAQELTPVITFTTSEVGSELEYTFANAADGENMISIDWGDGNIVEVATLEKAYDGWNGTVIKGTPVNLGEVKVYAIADLGYFACATDMNGPGITKLDVSKATELTEIYAAGNKLTSIDVSMLNKLTKLRLDNNKLTEMKLTPSLTTLEVINNELTSFDGSELTALTTLKINDNPLGTLDVSNMPALKYLYANNCGLTSLTVGALTTAKAYISVNNNSLETLDLSGATGLENGTLFANENNLTEIKFPAKVKTANIKSNKFTLATVPFTANVTSFNYAPQQAMEIEVVDGTVDLSSQKSVVVGEEAKATVYTWYTEDDTELVAGTDYTEEAGVFTFIAPQEQKVYCTMTNENVPKLTIKTIAVSIEDETTGIESIEAAELVGDIYTVDGKLIKRNASVAAMQKGLYIVKTAAGEAVKVICE